MHTTKEEWSKEFDKRFVVSSHGNIIWDTMENGEHVTHRDIKSFISSLLTQQAQEIREETVRELRDEMWRFCGSNYTPGEPPEFIFTKEAVEDYAKSKGITL